MHDVIETQIHQRSDYLTIPQVILDHGISPATLHEMQQAGLKIETLYKSFSTDSQGRDTIDDMKTVDVIFADQTTKQIAVENLIPLGNAIKDCREEKLDFATLNFPII